MVIYMPHMSVSYLYVTHLFFTFDKMCLLTSNSINGSEHPPCKRLPTECYEKKVKENLTLTKFPFTFFRSTHCQFSKYQNSLILCMYI